MTAAHSRRPILLGWRRKVLAAAAAAVVLFLAATARVLVWPPQGAPATADAIVLLAGNGDRLPVALSLARQHRAPVLVVSQGWMGYGGPCPPPTPGVKTICFDPNPGTTRGEAEYVGKLAARYGWHSLMVVATSPQAERARVMMGRCFKGTTYMVTAPMAVSSLPYQIVYGWAALFKAMFVATSC